MTLAFNNYPPQMPLLLSAGDAIGGQGSVPPETRAGNEKNHDEPLNIPVVGVAVWDVHLRCELINPVLAAMSDIRPELHLGKSPRDILGDAGEALEPALQRVLKTGQPVWNFQVSTTFPTQAEGGLWVISLFPTKKRGEVDRVVSTFVEVTRQKKLEQAVHTLAAKLGEERGRLQALLDIQMSAELGFEEIIGDSPALKRVLEKARVVAGSDATVLILGETGTGKELIARAIHRMSKRSTNSFIKMNCAAIPGGLLESELFGHEKGAFTGAVSQKVGRLELADKGTLFLDEIGDIPVDLQPKLLRVLQDREFERLGSTKTIRVDVRLISATNLDLAKSISEGEFRSDLFYRLNVFPIHMPSLRERRQDIPQLVRHFVNKLASRMKKRIDTITSETMEAFVNWGWPGNVREMENLIERAVILTKGPVLWSPIAELKSAPGTSEETGTLEAAKREHIIRILKETKGVISGPAGAAARLGLKRSTLQSKMRELGISRKDYVP